MSRTPTRSGLRSSAGFRFLLFALAGGAATAVHYAVLLLCAGLLAMDPVRASTLGAACGALVSYGLNQQVTFCAASAHRRALPRFAAMVALGLGLNALFMHGFVRLAGLHYLLSQVVTTLLVLVSNYAISAQWVFTPRGEK